jgi:hypothetical protein
MALTREQRIYLSVLAVAGAALAADRLFFGVTSPAVAAAANAIEQVATKPLEPVTQEPASARFAARLRAAARSTDDAPVDNLFAVRLVHENKAEQPAPAAASNAVRLNADAFRLAHRLSAVATGKGAYAVVNGRTVRMGEEIDGMSLIEVTREAAIFEGSGVRVELSVIADR